MKSREKRIISGNYLEVEHFPVTEHGHRHDHKKRLSRIEQQNLNEKNAIKKLIRLINTNFTKGDILIHCTYRADEMPTTETEVTKDIQNYFRRVKAYRKKVLCFHNKSKRKDHCPSSYFYIHQLRDSTNLDQAVPTVSRC